MSTHIHDFFSRQLFRKWLIGQRRKKWCSRHPISDYRYSEFRHDNEAIFFIFSTYLWKNVEFPNLPPLLTQKMRRYLYLSTFCTLSLFSTSVFWKNIMRNVFSLQSKNGDIVDDRVKLVFYVVCLLSWKISYHFWAIVVIGVQRRTRSSSCLFTIRY